MVTNASTFAIRITQVENGYTVVMLIGGAEKKTWVALEEDALLGVIKSITEGSHG